MNRPQNTPATPAISASRRGLSRREGRFKAARMDRDGPHNSRGLRQASAARHGTGDARRRGTRLLHARSSPARNLSQRNLTRDLARCAALERESMAIIAELTAYAAGHSGRAMVERYP